MALIRQARPTCTSATSHLTLDRDLCYSFDSAINNLITKNAPTMGGGLLVATKESTRWPAAAMNRDDLSTAYLYFTAGIHENATHSIHQVGFSRFCTLTHFILVLVACKKQRACPYSVVECSARLRAHTKTQVWAGIDVSRTWDDSNYQFESIPLLTSVSTLHRCLSDLLRTAPQENLWRVRHVARH